MSRPVVSVAMVMRDAAATVELALRSLLGQTYGDWELVLIDDGSRDASMERVRAIEDPRIRLHSDSLRKGLPTRLNQAIELARGRYLARMDADDVCYPERFARQVAFLDRHADVDLLAAHVMVFSGEGAVRGLRTGPQDHKHIVARPWAGFPMPHPTWMGRLEWFRRHRYAERALRAQDQELLLRSYRDSRFAALPEVLLGYRSGGVCAAHSRRGRALYLRTLIRNARDSRSLAMAALGAAHHAVGMLRDHLRRGAASPGTVRPTDEQVLAWRRVWLNLSEPGAEGLQ